MDRKTAIADGIARFEEMIGAAYDAGVEAATQTPTEPLPPQPTDNPIAAAAKFRDKVTGRPFATFYEASVDALGNRPEDSGLRDLHVIYQKAFLPGLPGSHGHPNRDKPTAARIAAAVDGAPELFVPDIELWLPKAGDGTAPLDDAAIENYEYVGDRINQVKGNKKWGWYGPLPPRTLFGIKDIGSDAKHAQYMRSNDRLRGMAAQVDFMCLSLYAFFDHFNKMDAAAIDLFRRYAVGNFEEAERLAPNKPKVGFLWTSFHNRPSDMIPAPFICAMAEAVIDAGFDGVDFWQTKDQREDPLHMQRHWFEGWEMFRDKRLERV